MVQMAETVTLDIENQFFEKQRLATEAADTHTYTLYGGARGPGKSYWLRWYALRFLILCNEAGLPAMRAGLFCESYPVLEDRQISRIDAEFPRELGRLKQSRTHGYGFHLRDDLGGGVLALRNLDDPGKYVGAEFGLIAVDQLEQNPLDTFNKVRGSLRWPAVRNVRFIATANPGGVGHHYVKAYWIDRDYPPELQPFEPEFVFVPALPDDNPHLDASYWQWLDSLPPALAAAWRWGNWDVFEGMAFSQWRRDVHVVPPIPLPAHWPRWCAIDWGFHAPFCCLWLCKDPDIGRIYVYREVYEKGLTDRQQARMIKANTPPDERINLHFADRHSFWTSKTFEDRTFTPADEYQSEGIILTKADDNRSLGKRKIDSLLARLPDGKPGLQIFETCPNLARTLGALPMSKTNPEDWDTDAEDHAPDALRYGLTNVDLRPAPAVVTAAQLFNQQQGDPLMRRLRRTQNMYGGRDF